MGLLLRLKVLFLFPLLRDGKINAAF